MAAVNFSVPTSLGGAPILGYTATCQSGAVGSPALGGHGLGFDFLAGPHTPVQTPAFNSTTGSIILVSVGRGAFSDFATAVVNDNKGNGAYTRIGTEHTYTKYPTSGTGLYAKLNAAGGVGHVVNASKPTTSDEATVNAIEFRNVDTIVDSAWIEDLTAPNTSATVTTTGPAILAAFWWGDDSNGNDNFIGLSAGWTLLDNTSNHFSNHVQNGSAYRIVSGAGTYSITWTSNISQGAQLWIVAMQQSGAGAAFAATGWSSPILVKGLSNSTGYSCSVVANNSAGTSAASSAVSVTPQSTTPFGFVSAQSRKTHGSAGTFDLGIDTAPISGQVSVEPRTNGVNHSLAFQFNGPVTSAGSVAVSPAGAGVTAISGNEVIATLNSVSDNQRTTVTLSNVNGALNVPPVTLGFSSGDFNRSRSINASDISAIKTRSGQAVNGGNFLFDMDLSGVVNATDISAAKAKTGVVLP